MTEKKRALERDDDDHSCCLRDAGDQLRVHIHQEHGKPTRVRVEWGERVLVDGTVTRLGEQQAVGPTKTCAECKQPKRLVDFHRSGHSKDGHRSVCIACTTESRRKRDYTAGGA